jgi:hypothetical protein
LHPQRALLLLPLVPQTVELLHLAQQEPPKQLCCHP